MQAAVDPVPDRVQVVKTPVTPVSPRLTAPVGVAVPEEVTVTVHLDPWLTTTGEVQETAVVVD